jgi:molybdopterin synthase sulfur carrier subunit
MIKLPGTIVNGGDEMQVIVRLFATLREGRFNEQKLELEKGSRVIDVINKYELPKEQIAICYINGRDADNECLLHDGDTISLFPPVGGG